MFDFFKGTVTPKDWIFVGVVVAITVLLCAGFYFVILNKQQAKLDGHIADLEVAKNNLQEARDIERNFEKFKQDSDKMSSLVQGFEKRLPEKREIPTLIGKFETLGREKGLLVELSPKPSTRDATKETIPYRVTARGDFHQIVSFINLFERDERYLKVSDLKIGEEEAMVSTATFTLSTFRFLQADAGGAT
jgi:Tfp pilus assembly protein PilO